MTIYEWLTSATAELNEAHIETARLDSLVLLSDELKRDKSWILGHPEHILQRSDIKILNTKIIQRAQHVPLAYIRGHAEFFGRKFTVNEHVLVPRPESEAIIELLKANIPNTYKGTIIDIGTGSGILGITAALEFPAAQVYATDIDSNALLVARDNAMQHHVALTFAEGDLLAALSDETPIVQSAILLANLPYVPEDYPVNKAATHEPPLAIFAGDGGLEQYKKLCAQLTVLNAKPSAVITESLCIQHEKIVQLMRTAGYTVQSTNGLAQYFAYNLS